MTRSGQLFALQTLEPHIAANASSFWPTATSNSDKSGLKRYAQGGMPLSAEVVMWGTPMSAAGTHSPRPVDHGIQLANQVDNWPTHTANRATYSNGHQGFQNLEEASEQWPSPTAHDGRRPGAELTSTQGANLKREAIEWQSPDTGGGGRTTKGSQRQAESGLGNQSEMWATPTTAPASMYAENRDMRMARGRERATLATQADKAWATPTSRDHKDGANPSENVATNSLLGRQAPRTEMPGPTSSSDGPNLRRRLNPLFVAWLMGMETDWLDLTSFASSGTE